jgi:hypothetical protein
LKYKKRQASANACQGEKVKIYPVFILSPKAEKSKENRDLSALFDT